jgi:hypothetical protein
MQAVLPCPGPIPVFDVVLQQYQAAPKESKTFTYSGHNAAYSISCSRHVLRRRCRKEVGILLCNVSRGVLGSQGEQMTRLVRSNGSLINSPTASASESRILFLSGCTSPESWYALGSDNFHLTLLGKVGRSPPETRTVTGVSTASCSLTIFFCSTESFVSLVSSILDATVL